MLGFFRVGLAGADSGSSFKGPSIKDSGRADCDRSKSVSPEYRLSLVLRSGKSPDFSLVRLPSASSFTGYLMVNRPVDRGPWGCSPGHVPSLRLHTRRSSLACTPWNLMQDCPHYCCLAQCSHPGAGGGPLRAGRMEEHITSILALCQEPRSDPSCPVGLCFAQL